MTTLYRKYRPAAWSEVSGQNHVKMTLGFEIASGKIAHAYLFSGPRGIGKTTAARIFSRAVNCIDRAKLKPADPAAGEPCGTCEACVSVLEGRSLDVIEIDAASHRGIDAVRENIIENARFSPSRLKYKVFIIDEVHMLTNEAFNALLKTLEEPPAHAVFILATTELHKVPATILSRCQRFDFRKIPFNDLIDRLHRLCEREKVKVDRRTLEDIARSADGSLRDAESLLGKVLTMGDGKRVTYDEALVVLPRSDVQAVAAFVGALLHHDARSAIMTIGDCVEGGSDIDQFATDAVELLRKTMLAKMSGTPDVFSAEMDEESRKQLSAWAAAATMPDLVHAMEVLMEKRREIKSAHPAQLPLELAAMKICERITASAPAPDAAPKPALKAASVPVKTETPKAVSAATVTTDLDEPKSQPLPSKVASAADDAPITTVEKIKDVWQNFMAKAGEANGSLPYVLGVGQPVEVVGKVVRIGFDFAFHRDKVNNEKNRRVFEEALGALLGAAVRIEGVLLEKKAEVLATGVPAASVDGNLLQAFGGRVVE